MLKRLIPAHTRRLLAARLLPVGMATYSQSGEDKIMAFFLGAAGLQNPIYIDAGSSHPILGNNTYLLYRRGCRGICVDPTPGLAPLYRTYRPRDLFMPSALVPGNEAEITMHLFEEGTLNSASADHAKQYASFGFDERPARRVPAINLERLCSQYQLDSPDLLCLDVEGLDFEILQGANFSRVRPKLICLEAVSYQSDKTPVVDPRFAELLQTKGYVRYADTFINQIYADKAHYARLRLL